MTLRVPRTFIVLGYLGVVAATIAWIVASPGLNAAGQIYNILTTVGYGLAGLAWWQWSAAIMTDGSPTRSLRRPSRTMAAGSIVFAIAFAALTENNIRYHVANHIAYQPHYRLSVAGGASFVVGLSLAAVGFWLASNTEVRSLEPDREKSFADAE
jgi:hypothetical protein